MSDLEILQIKSMHDDADDKKLNKLSSELCKPPFLGVINGSVRSGKSVVLMNFVYNNYELLSLYP